MIINLKCGDDRILTVDQSKFLISGAANIDTVTCEFGDAWKGTFFAVFSRNGAVYHVEQNDGAFAVPHEVISTNGIVKIGMFAADGEKVTTSTVLQFAVAEGAITEATAIADPTPDIYQQLLDDIGALDKRIDDLIEQGVTITVDEKLSETSKNPVQNKAVSIALRSLAEQDNSIWQTLINVRSDKQNKLSSGNGIILDEKTNTISVDETSIKSVVSMEQTVISTEDGGENKITATLTDGTTQEFVVRNGNKGKQGEEGYTPVKGVDYFTDADMAEIIDEVYAKIADGNEEEY